ncbi:heat shock protein Hsp20 [Chitinispirillum alkaliphilum]|nr:heat shock protein Hsp20 [Chitinispirillum alkaliphilum]
MLWPRDPFKDFEKLRSEMENIFSRVPGFRTPVYEFPLVNIYDTHEELVLVAEIPGVNKENIDINFHRNTLVLSGKRELPRYGNSQILRQEQPEGSFEKRVRIPVEVKSSEVSAFYEDGVLKVVMPKSEELRPRQIIIES